MRLRLDPENVNFDPVGEKLMKEMENSAKYFQDVVDDISFKSLNMPYGKDQLKALKVICLILTLTLPRTLILAVKNLFPLLSLPLGNL